MNTRKRKNQLTRNAKLDVAMTELSSEKIDQKASMKQKPTRATCSKYASNSQKRRLELDTKPRSRMNSNKTIEPNRIIITFKVMIPLEEKNRQQSS
eukprot:snap_masked-scaffold_33-processed-gene-3.36-mRNA-1 protein AED:1.00 eAED:1.00 QI:0/0/0/0/1/1/2/0/95